MRCGGYVTPKNTISPTPAISPLTIPHPKPSAPLSSSTISPPKSSTITPPELPTTLTPATPTTFSINNAVSQDNDTNSCIATRIKGRNAGTRYIQAIIDTGNNLPHVALSLESFNALKRVGIIKTDIQKTDIKASSADSNQIEVVGIVNGKWTIYLGKRHAVQIKTFIVIRNLMHAMNIGLCLLQSLGAVLDFGKNVLQIGESKIPLLRPRETPNFSNAPALNIVSNDSTDNPKPPDNSFPQGDIRAYNKKTVKIPPYSLAVLKLKTHSRERRLATDNNITCLLYTSPSPRDKRQSRMPSSA